MPGKALIDGTLYDITCGKTRVSGTLYDISYGKTLIGGTFYNITFLSPLAKLFKSMQIVASLHSYSTTSGTYASDVGYIAASGFPKWLFLNSGAGISIYYIRGSSYSPSLINSAGSYYSPSLTSYGSQVEVQFGGYNRQPIYSAQMTIAEFPGYTASAVNDLLSNMTITVIAGRNSYSGNSISYSGTLDQSALYLQSFLPSSSTDDSYFSICTGKSPHKALLSYRDSTSYNKVWWWERNPGYGITTDPRDGCGFNSCRGGIICQITE